MRITRERLLRQLQREGDGIPTELSLARKAEVFHEGGTFRDRLVWAMVVPAVTFPVFGPIQGADERPASYVAPALVFVDASTGELLGVEG